MSVRPSIVPLLDTNKSNRAPPAGSKITDGYLSTNLLPHDAANYLWGYNGDWLEWLDERTEDGVTPGTDLSLRGLDALTVTGDGGVVTITGGDGGGTSGDGGNIALMPGGVTSGTIGMVGVGTLTPLSMLHLSGVSPKIALTDTDTNADSSIDAGSTNGSLKLSADENDEVANTIMHFHVDGTSEAVLDPSGLRVTHGIYVGSIGTAPTDDEIRCDGDLHVGGKEIFFGVGSDDKLAYDDALDEYQMWADGTEEWTFGAAALDCHDNNLTSVGTIASDTVTATGSGSGDDGVIGTGNGAGSGVKAVAGATGHGVESTCAAAGGSVAAVYGDNTAVGGGTGVEGRATGANGWGVYGLGNNTGLGVRGDGSPGVYGAGGGSSVTNANGIEGYGLGTGLGVSGTGTDGYGVVAESDTTTPAKAALRIVPQDTDPGTSPLEGDVIMHGGTHKLKFYNGTAWETVTSAV